MASEWLDVVYAEAARKLAEREQEREKAKGDQRQSASKSEYSGASRSDAAERGAARPL